MSPFDKGGFRGIFFNSSFCIQHSAFFALSPQHSARHSVLSFVAELGCKDFLGPARFSCTGCAT